MSENGVIVGYASSDDDAAFDWAAREAKVRGVPLTICHVWQLMYPRTDSLLADGMKSRSGRGLRAGPASWTTADGPVRMAG